jgi:cobaltochelatase CobN
MSDYPARGGRAGFAVGLDTPASVAGDPGFFGGAGYDVNLPLVAERSQTRDPFRNANRSVPIPGLASSRSRITMTVRTSCRPSPRARRLRRPARHYRAWLATHPGRCARTRSHQPRRKPEPTRLRRRLPFPPRRFGNLAIALQPAARSLARPQGALSRPRRAAGPRLSRLLSRLCAALERIDALIHLGTHGTTEWLPGKAVALSAACWPRLVLGALPVIYPYVVDDPGEAAPAKRRLVGRHARPPAAAARDGRDTAGEPRCCATSSRNIRRRRCSIPRRAELVAREIRDRAEATGLAIGVRRHARDRPMARR